MCVCVCVCVMNWGARGGIVIVIENGLSDLSSFPLDNILCISQSANSLSKNNNPIIPSSAMGKYLGRLASLAFVW